MIFVRDAVRFIPVGVFQLVQSGRTKLVYFANQSAYSFISTKRAFLTCHAVHMKAIVFFFFCGDIRSKMFNEVEVCFAFCSLAGPN